MMIRNRAKRSRGAAYAEAIIMLPVFIVTLWGYQLLFSGHRARTAAMSQARHAAWASSMEGCGLGEDAISTCPGCDGSSDSAPGDVPGDAGAIWDRLQDIPFIGGILSGLFGPMVDGSGSQTYASTYSGARSDRQKNGEARAAVHVVCNTKRETLGDIIKRALCNTPVVGALVSFIPDFC